MKTRQEIKASAKQQVKGNILVMFLIGLVLGLVTIVAVIAIPMIIGGKAYIEMEKAGNDAKLLEEVMTQYGGLLLLSNMVLLIAYIIFFAIGEWGQAKNSNVMFKGEKATFKNGFIGFKQFGSAFGVYFLKTLYLTLWSLLAIVTLGIGYIVALIKTYSYSCATYIKQEYPETGANECITQSREAMYGNKWRLFVQDLSFLGWFILSIFTFGILLIWVAPYFYQARYNFYQSIKQTVIESKSENQVETKSIESKI